MAGFRICRSRSRNPVQPYNVFIAIHMRLFQYHLSINIIIVSIIQFVVCMKYKISEITEAN